jgi:hypothetical protein
MYASWAMVGVSSVETGWAFAKKVLIRHKASVKVICLLFIFVSSRNCVSSSLSVPIASLVPWELDHNCTLGD